MFGKLSLWAANTYHGPAIPKLDIQHDAQQAAQDMPAWAKLYQTPDALVADPQGFNPVNFDRWNAHEKAQFIYEHRRSKVILLISKNIYYVDDKIYAKLQQILQTCNPSDIRRYLSEGVQHEHVIKKCIVSIWAEMLITRYMLENAGHIQANLISWIPSAVYFIPLDTGNFDEEKLLHIQSVALSGIIPYVIQNNIPPKLEFKFDNYQQIIAAVKQAHACPMLNEYMRIFAIRSNVYNLNFTEEEYEAINLKDRDIIHKQMANINHGIAFVKFEKHYTHGIPLSLHAKWSQYATLSGNMFFVINALQKPWNKKRMYVICGLLNTPMMDEIYHMFQ